MRKLLLRLSDRLPARAIDDGTTVYLERYYVGTFLGLRCYLHRFVGSDPDRGLHDHPWSWAVSLILSGWYFEERRAANTPRKVRWINFLTGDSFHRVILEPGRECWSLFIHRAARSKGWGFWQSMNSETGDSYFKAFVYPGGGATSGEWWTTAPKGRDIRNNDKARAASRIDNFRG